MFFSRDDRQRSSGKLSRRKPEMLPRIANESGVATGSFDFKIKLASDI